MGDPQVVSERGRRVSMPGSGNRTAVGRRSEHAAAEYLERQGYEIIERNYFTRFGEIDLVALSPEGELVFAEVKYRTTHRDGGGVAAVNRRKIHTMRHVALLWLAARRGQGEQRFSREFDLRFDVIDMGPEGLREHIEGVW